MYQATIKAPNESDMAYVKSTEGRKEEKFNDHKSSFTKKRYAINTMFLRRYEQV